VAVTNTNGCVRVDFQNGRPIGIGYAINSSTIQVTFPDDATYQGKVDTTPSIRWSNNTVWHLHLVF
jgi:hypothetical protein